MKQTITEIPDKTKKIRRTILKIIVLIFIAFSIFTLVMNFVSASLLDELGLYYTLNETSGTTAIDMAGNFNGTIDTGVIINKNGKFNNSYLFNNTGNKSLEAGDVNWTENMTINFWINKSTAYTGEFIFNKYTTTYTDGLYIETGTQVFCLFPSCDSFNSSIMYDVGIWTMITLRKTGTNWEIFKNGIAKQNITHSSGSAQTNFRLGNRGTGGDAFGLSAYLDEFGIWNRKLSIYEINSLLINSYPFNATLTNFSITAKDLFNQSISITNFSADIDGSIYNTTIGIINNTNINKTLNEIHNITIFSNENGGYFNKTYFNYNTGNNLIATIYQAEANITIYAKILNISIPINAITNATIFTNPQQSVNNYTDRFYLRANQNITIRYTAGYSFFQYLTFDIPPLFNGTLDLTNLYNQSLIVQLRDGNNNSVINSYNLTIFNTAYNYSENFNTTNGNVTIQTLKSFPLNFTFIPANINYSILNTNFTTIDNTTNFRRFYTLTANSINISIYNETSSTFITETINIRFTSDYIILDYSTATGKKYIDNIPEGFYSVKFTAPSGNYGERTYYVSIFNRTSTSLNAYLPLINVSALIYIYLKTIDNNILENGLITIQKQFNTTWLTIAQKYTDVTGLAVFNLINAETYKLIISAVGYTTREFELQVYFVNSPYNIKLEPTGYTPYTNAYQYVQYYYAPTSSIVTPQSAVNFSITTFSNESKLQYTYIKVNGSILNITGSPSGATALLSYDLTNYQGTIPVTYGFKVQGFNPILWTITYYVNQNHGYDTDIYTTLTAVRTEVNNQGWTTLIAIFVAVVVAITITQLSGNPTISTIGAFVVIIFFLLIGWLPLTAVAFASVIGLLMLYLQRGGY